MGQALSLWQGPPLADFRYEPFAQAEIARLEELHLTCLEERIEADLALGSAGCTSRLSCGDWSASIRCESVFAASSCSPSTASGRQTEALEVYREFRSVLRDELGLDTSPQLRELEAAILRHDSCACTSVDRDGSAAGA